MGDGFMIGAIAAQPTNDAADALAKGAKAAQTARAEAAPDVAAAPPIIVPPVVVSGIQLIDQITTIRENRQAIDRLKLGTELLIARYLVNMSIASYMSSPPREKGLGIEDEAQLTPQMSVKPMALFDRLGESADMKDVQVPYLKVVLEDKVDVSTLKDEDLYESLRGMVLNPVLPETFRDVLSTSLGANLSELKEREMMVKVQRYLVLAKGEQIEMLKSIAVLLESIIARYLVNMSIASYMSSPPAQKGLGIEDEAQLTPQMSAKPMVLFDQLGASADMKDVQIPYLEIIKGRKLIGQVYSDEQLYKFFKGLCPRLPDAQKKRLMPYFHDSDDINVFDEIGFLRELNKIRLELQEQPRDAFELGYSDDAVTREEAQYVGAARVRLNQLDYRLAQRKITIAGINNNGTVILLRKFFWACRDILAANDNKDYGQVLAEAEKIYNARMKKILKDKVNYMKENKATVVNFMSFEDCLRNEIEGRSISYASLALIQAFGPFKYEDWDDRVDKHPQWMKDGFLTGVPMQLAADLTDFVK